jgi:signal transduction histidine kinase
MALAAGGRTPTLEEATVQPTTSESPTVGLRTALIAATAVLAPARINVLIAVSKHVDVPDAVARVLVRTVSEGCANVLKHAQDVTRLEIDVRKHAANILLTMTNDGAVRGMPTSLMGGYGLSGLKNLVATIGGSLTAGAECHGWLLTALVPASQAPADS